MSHKKHVTCNNFIRLWHMQIYSSFVLSLHSFSFFKKSFYFPHNTNSSDFHLELFHFEQIKLLFSIRNRFFSPLVRVLTFSCSGKFQAHEVTTLNAPLFGRVFYVWTTNCVGSHYIVSYVTNKAMFSLEKLLKKRYDEPFRSNVLVVKF